MKSRKKETPAPEPKSSAVSRFQAFTTETIHRSQLKGAPYNPRYMRDKARVRLKETLQKVGLVQPIVWNKRSGMIVGGHQRINQLDALEGSADYSLTVAVVDVDDARERELNVLLNNQEVCGEWDFEKLQEILAGEIDLLATGFDRVDYMKLFGETNSQASDSCKDALAESAEKLKETYKKLTDAHRHMDDPDFYLVVVFGSYAERKEFTDCIGLDDNRYVDGRTLMSLLKDKTSNRAVEVEEPKAPGDSVELAPSGGGEQESKRPAKPRRAG